jgi:hypothetical protein
MSWIIMMVLREDIDDALADPRLRFSRDDYCPVARAASRAMEMPLGTVAVDGVVVQCAKWKDASAVAGSLPKKARVHIERFDAGNEMKPFSFRVKLKSVV